MTITFYYECLTSKREKKKKSDVQHPDTITMKQITLSHQSQSQSTEILVETHLTQASDHNTKKCTENHCIPDIFCNCLQVTLVC